MEKIKIVYGYDPATGEYTGEKAAHLCPVTKSEYLIPANTVEVKPPKPDEGYAVVIDNGEWTQTPDERGKDIYDCQTGEKVGHVNYLTDRIEEGQTTKAPPKGGAWKGGKWEAPTPPTAQELARQAILDEIARLEGQVTNRRLRESILGTDNGWLAAQDALIAVERSKL